MSNGYILDITGKIKKRVSNDYEDIDLNNKADFENLQNKNNFNKDVDNSPNNDTYLGNYLKEIGPGKFSTSPVLADFLSGVDGAVQTISNTTPSFGFYNEEGDVLDDIQQTAFRRFNSYLDVNDNNEVIPFVDEFEFYTGYRAIQPDAEAFILDDALLFILEYFADVLIETVIIEGMILLYKTKNIGSPSKDKSFIKNQKDYSLVLGEYILEEADVFSRYFFDVLNYPIEEEHYKISTTEPIEDLKKLANYSLKRLSCYLIGLSELISVDRLIDWKYIMTNVFKLSESNADSIKMIANSILDVTLSTLTNTASLKKLMLIVKKFNTQKYWVDSQLYSAKRKTYLDYITDNYNYYYFKFFIERVNVGIKIWNRYVIDDDFNTKSLSSYIQKDNNKDNRLAQEFNNENTSHMREVSYSLDDNAESVKSDLIDLYLSTDSVVSQDKINEIKNNIAAGKRKTAHYKFSYKLNSLAMSEIPSALMYNTGFKTNLNYTSSDEQQPTKPEYKLFAKTQEKYLPIELVNEIEDKLESEYVPFYFHDLRTNEILSFHAFIENISDSYSPEYTSTGGFGRIDDVKAYVKTTRSISLSFLVAAMNELDHQYMWAYLNKLTSMVYPQWTKGEELIIDDLVLQQPFSQVPGNSPLVRLRIGDLIKNNYSRFNLERIFGFDDLRPPAKIARTTVPDTPDSDPRQARGTLEPDPPNEPSGPTGSARTDAILADSDNQKKDEIMKPFVDNTFDVNNPITQAYESRMSKGLAGHITNLDFNYADSVWETKKGSKAPMLVKVTLQFAPIHDIPPGLDYKGMPRAVNYSVGDINIKLSSEKKWNEN
jgi:hypothetical protein